MRRHTRVLSRSTRSRRAVVAGTAGVLAAALAPAAQASTPGYISSPAEGATISGPKAVVEAVLDWEASYCTSWKVDGKTVTWAQAGERGFEFDTTKLSDGVHTFMLDSRECYGENGTSTRRFVVRNVAPAVRITAPSPDRAVSGADVKVVAEATADPGGTQHIAHVDFFLDDEFLVRDEVAPFDADVDATRLSNGPHSLRAVATDSVGLVGRSQESQMTVGNYRSNVAAGASRQQVAAGQAVTLTGVVSRVEDGEPVAGAAVSLHVRRGDQTGWARLTTVTSDAHGRVSATASPQHSSLYQWRYAGGAGSSAATSSQVRVNVTPAVALRLGTTARRGAVLSGSVRLTPATGGQPLVLQSRASGGTWRSLASGVSAPGATAVEVAFSRAGTYDVRVQRRANAVGTAAESNVVRVRVR